MKTEKTLNEILKDSGVKTIYPENKKDAVFLEYQGKKILRPNPERCYEYVQNYFGIDLRNFE